MALHKTTDGGTNWNTHKVTTNAGIAYAVAVASNDRNLIFVGGRKGGNGAVFKSVDGGTTWTEIGQSSFSKPSIYITDIAIDPQSNNFVYVGDYSGLFKSADGGATWAKVFSQPVEAILVDPHSPNKIYVGGMNGIYFSSNRGASWQDDNTGLTNKDILCLDMNPISQVVYAGSNGGSVFQNKELDVYTLTITAGEGGTTSPAPGAHVYASGTTVEIEAIPDSGYRFSGWSGSETSEQNPLTLTMNSNKSMMAHFEVSAYPPEQLTGRKILNRSLFLSQYINVIEWRANPQNSGIAKYRIYLQNGSLQLLGEVDANTFVYWHKGVEKNREYTYAVTAVNNENIESEPAFITIR